MPELLRIAKELQDRAHERETTPANVDVAPNAAPDETPEDDAAAPSPPSSNAPHRNRRARSGKSRTSRSAPEPAAVPDPTPAVLLVSSTPSGLLVEVDGKRVDLTPTRLNLDPGSHSIALVKGPLRLFETDVRLAAGAIQTLDPDVTDKIPPDPAPAAEPTTPEATRSVAQTPPPRPVAPPRPVEMGEVYVDSPNVYGEVWIGGKSRGYPPLVLKQVPVGRTTVEIRVDGIVRRTETIDIAAKTRRTLRFR